MSDAEPTVLDLFAVDPIGFGGVILSGPPSLARDRWLAGLAACIGPLRRLPPGIDDARLIGGLDVAATLAAGRPIAAGGLLAEADGGVVVVPMAERIGDGLAGRLAAVLDTGEVVVERDGAAARSPARVALVLLDEGVEEERVPDGLAERISFHVKQDLSSTVPDPAAVERARERLATVGAASDAVLQALCAAAALLGVDSARAVVFALRAARVAAALGGRNVIGDEDAVMAAQLVLAPRATRAPPLPEEQADEPPPPPPSDEAPDDADRDEAPRPDALTEIVLAAVRAALPAQLLAGGATPRSRRRGGVEGGRGAGERRLSWRRGRPTGTRAGTPGGGKRLALAATLAAAAVWQRARRGELVESGPGPVIVRPSDLRVRRFETRTEATVIVVVDASGSAALARLAEAKGAVELLLAQAYVLRTQVALIVFRGSGAEVLLPPTRSLTRARRVLGEMAGGGGTPLAAGLDAARMLAMAVRARGRTPRLVVLTDGRGNVARAPEAGRAQAELDATNAASLVRAAGIAAILIDTAPRPRPATAAFAATMGARYLALPRLDADAVANAAVAHAAAA
ncbi:magnesium chelatase subunit D [Sphingosinicellaceae bacterium]|nr:magnesium chelatase subunit D [Sphingosinicellaceae bacterium]